MTDLVPCKLCGSPGNIVRFWATDTHPLHRVHTPTCTNPDCRGERYKTEEEAIHAWNRDNA